MTTEPGHRRSQGRRKPPWPLLVIGIVSLLIVVNVARGGPSSTPAPPAPPPLAPAPVIEADTHELGQWVEWSAGEGRQPYRLGQYRIVVSAGYEEGLREARLEISDANGLATSIRGHGSTFDASIAFAVVQLDASDPVQQLVVSSYSGGAHCCTTLTVLEVRENRWLSHDLGSWDGDRPDIPVDLDGDGIKEFRFRDPAFLYTFASYAESWSPPVFKQLAQGRLTDVSTKPSLRPHFEAFAARSRQACIEGSNGACAAHAAAGARAGDPDAAWRTMIGAYNQASDWGLTTACRLRTPKECPAEARLEFATFPEALQWFLGDQGYTPASYIPPLQAAGPSFDCGAAQLPAETLICADHRLAILDRTMAVAFARATALSADRSELRASQRNFLAARNTQNDVTQLAEAYEERINILLAVD